MKGLVGMGFGAKASRRALAVVSCRHARDGTAMPVGQLLREALAVLT